jgi:hypothetical protein
VEEDAEELPEERRAVPGCNVIAAIKERIPTQVADNKITKEEKNEQTSNRCVFESSQQCLSGWRRTK